ncbi:MAG: bifunctional diaminohydroxyphosphoribosylaminopyrimidine deaminase/5-amino-6-(5-phosphoribosylamino)uracil reductase RibD [Tepidisphaeraceae bacterium]
MSDTDLMRRAIEMAMRGRGRVEPNPMVGCVIARQGRIIAEGHHQQFGGPHAEANALAVCADPAGATAFVSLEPCCGYAGKRSPPCTRALIGSKLSRVVAACRDPNPFVSGKGLAELRSAGIAVEEGLLADEARQLDAAYFKTILRHRPYVTLKWAQTADGRIAGPGGQRLAISNDASLSAMHQLRSRSDAILVGIGTVRADDPLLTARVPNPRLAPLRIVLDTHLRLGLDSQIVRTASQSPPIVCCGQSAFDEKADLISRMNSFQVEVLPLRVEADGRLSLDDLLDKLGKRGLTHLLVEPGPTLAESFLRRNLADRVWIFRSPKRIGPEKSPEAAKIDYPATGSVALDGDELTEYLNPDGSAFHTLQKSADLALVMGH